jgi:NAD(P)-dependent dehydrogenase (short-subunit alcohol dehydrogenase family)
MRNYADLFRLDGKCALITGSSRGIGRAIAEAMAAHGARVVISSRKADACAEVAQAIRHEGGEAVSIPCNISRENELAALAARSAEAYGHVDILVLNAAVNPHFGPIGTVTPEMYEKTMTANVRSNLWLANLMIPAMAERRDGAVVIVSSVAGLKGSKTIGVYALSKAADMQLARNLAVEWGPHNVRVNCIAPSIIRTDMARALWENPETYRLATSSYPLRRIGEVADVAGAALFLAAPAGRFVTGQTLVVDGGATIASEI